MGMNPYKYVINAPAQTYRYLSQNHLQLNSNSIFLFSRTLTETVSGLSCLMYENAMLFRNSQSKIYGDERLFDYL